MPAYFIVDIDVTDPARYEDYKALAPAAIARYGGRYLVRGGPVEVLEGDVAPGRIVVLEFPTMADAEAFWSSPEYDAARSIRREASDARVLLAAGLKEQP